jgi:hypothetical protein
VSKTSEHWLGSLQAMCSDGVVTLLDHSCGACPECTAGWPLYCTSIRDEGVTALVTAGNNPEAVLRRVTTASALAALAPDSARVVLCLDEASPEGPTLADFVRCVYPGPVLEATSPTDPHVVQALAGSTSLGRADIVVTTSQARAAVKAVRRGRWVCLPFAEVVAPTITELVQREVTLVAPRALADFSNVGGM